MTGLEREKKLVGSASHSLVVSLVTAATVTKGYRFAKDEGKTTGVSLSGCFRIEALVPYTFKIFSLVSTISGVPSR